MENTSLPAFVLALIATLVAATAGWFVRGRLATMTLAALTLVGLGTLAVLASAPRGADRRGT